MHFIDDADVLKTHYMREIGRLRYSTNRIAEPKKDDSEKTDVEWMVTLSSQKRT